MGPLAPPHYPVLHPMESVILGTLGDNVHSRDRYCRQLVYVEDFRFRGWILCHHWQWAMAEGVSMPQRFPWPVQQLIRVDGQENSPLEEPGGQDLWNLLVLSEDPK